MSRKTFCLICFVLMLSMALASTAGAQNQIRNWEFDEPLVTGGGGDINTHWWLWEGVNFTGLSVVQGAALSGENALHVAMPDGASGSLQVYQSFMKLEQGVTYTISFMARADAPRTITVRLMGRTLYNWQTFWTEAGIELTTEPQTFTFQYEHTGATVGGTGTFNDDIDWCFDHAGSDVDAYYDHIWLGEGPPPLPVAPDSANSPSPADGAIYTDTWATLSWMPGDSAVSHDVYLGESFNDVNDGTGDTFRGNQGLAFFVVGFPGYPYPDGLVPGTTYYWRVDEVNDADPNSPWKGIVWSFMIPSKKAYEPVPGDGVKFVDTEKLVLSWTPGLGAILHTVYFGDDYDTVANATNGVALGLTNFNPGPLELEKTYFWRVDELEAQGTHKGDVWSFTTAKAGGGIRGDYYKGMNFDNFVLTRTDPLIDFSWGDPGGPDPAVGDDSFSARWTGEVEAAFTETYTFYTSTDDGVRLWVDGRQLVDAWVDQGTTEYRGTIDLVAGNTYSLVMEYYENGGGAVAELRWSSPSMPKDFVPQAALSLPVKASSPTPRSGSVDVKQTTDLRWGSGDAAASHEVYFGTDADAVANADKSSPEYKGTKALGDESYNPGKLNWETTYYWRVDEINTGNPDSPWVGNLWSFTTAGFLIIDNFESYDAGENQIWYSWHDGLGYGTPGTADYFAGNGTGGAVGDETTASYTEETIVHGGSKAMPLAYDNNKQGYSKYSETELKLTAPRDWTEEGVTELSLWFYGDSNNSAELLYVAVSNSTGTPAVVVNNDPAAATTATWTEWVIPLQAFADQGINLTNVDRIAVGLGSRGNMAIAGGSGKMFFDDIRLYRPSEIAEE